MFNISITSITNGHIVGTPAVATATKMDTTSKYMHELVLCTYVYMYVHLLHTCVSCVHLFSYVIT